ncbi:hypothetical protein O1L60_15165 [Streptomyces diastatochromogenes]|nr:hypothetical protein [Streptomyces diastatochromogenes]
MSSRAKPKILAVALGAVLLIGGGFVAQAVADSAPRPAPWRRSPRPPPRSPPSPPLPRRSPRPSRRRS